MPLNFDQVVGCPLQHEIGDRGPAGPKKSVDCFLDLSAFQVRVPMTLPKCLSK